MEPRRGGLYDCGRSSGCGHLNFKWCPSLCTNESTLFFEHIHLIVRKRIVGDIRCWVFQLNDLVVDQLLNFIFQGKTCLNGMPFHPRMIGTSLIMVISRRISINKHNRNRRDVARFYKSFVQLAYGFGQRSVLFFLEIGFRSRLGCWNINGSGCLDMSWLCIVYRIGRTWELWVCLIRSRRLI